MQPQPNLGTTLYGQPQELFGKEVPGDWTVAQSDINQGALGDCFLLSSLMEVIRQGQLTNHPTFINNMITQNPDGTETVKLYQASGQNQFFTATPIYETVNNSFDPNSVNANPSQDIIAGSGGAKEIWAQVIEKAYAQLEGGYQNIEGGFPIQAMEALTGQQAYTAYPFEQTYKSLIQLTNAHDMIVFETAGAEGTITPQGLLADHCYAFEGYSSTSAIKIGDPYHGGSTQTVAINQLGADFDLMAVGKL